MDLVFAVSAGVGIGSALLVVTRRNPVYSAVWLLVCFLSFAVVFLRLAAPFLAAMHVLVYTGAILVLFLFVIMLLNLKEEELGAEYSPLAKGVCALLCAALFAAIALPLVKDASLDAEPPPVPADFGGVESVGMPLFREYAFPFELVSVLIIVAMLGAVVLAKKKL